MYYIRLSVEVGCTAQELLEEYFHSGLDSECIVGGSASYWVLVSIGLNRLDGPEFDLVEYFGHTSDLGGSSDEEPVNRSYIDGSQFHFGPALDADRLAVTDIGRS